MDELIQQERFELEVLNLLQSKKLLSNLVFAGGTMLRLCYNLNRYSVDLDFWVTKKIDFKKLYNEIIKCLGSEYKLTDNANKTHTMLFEIKSKNFPRKLKIEIRKELKEIKSQMEIVFSPHSNVQVLVNTVSLEDMMNAKIAALSDRREIRDAFDIEFLLRKGIKLNVTSSEASRLIKIIESFTKSDYKVKLGSLLDSEIREYYVNNNFSLLKMELQGFIK